MGRNITQIDAPNTSTTSNIVSEDVSGVIAFKTAETAPKLELYCIKKEAKTGLRELIIKSVPSDALKALDHKDYGFSHITPLELHEHLETNALHDDITHISSM